MLWKPENKLKKAGVMNPTQLSPSSETKFSQKDYQETGRICLITAKQTYINCYGIFHSISYTG